MGFPFAISYPGYLLDGVTIQPLVAFQYTHVNQDGYTETGAGVSNLVVGAQNESSERLSLGVLMTKDFKTPAGTLRPYVEGRYTHEFNDGSSVVNSNFSGGGAVVSQGADPGENFIEARIGASLDLSERTSLYGGVEGRYSTDSCVNGVFAGVRVRF
jgi:outer membrane lipase/esterase